ncbi:MAG: hypothetical protein LC731_04005, partial [Acidobacteria bacterium]|nr:hypothetical protein [Acidobacteriota bacterium]
SLNFRLLVWTDRPRRHPQIKSEINYRIRQLFLEEGIEIPFPQSEFRIRGGRSKVASDGDTLARHDSPEEGEEAESR